jgi:hypothetical protein
VRVDFAGVCDGDELHVIVGADRRTRQHSLDCLAFYIARPRTGQELRKDPKFWVELLKSYYQCFVIADVPVDAY